MPVDADEALRRATLIRSDPSLRGVTRRNIAEEEGDVLWQYLAPDGDPIEEEDRVQRWNSMGLPPAWEDVWICPNPRGHIQATGRDVKGRLQYRYHPDWTEITTEMKYDDVVYFASQLPRLRRQVIRDLEAAKMNLNTVSALVVRLIDLYNIRVGSDEYAKANESYGLTTLKSMHVKHVRGDEAEGRHDAVFSFTGKSGKNWDITIEDDHLVDLILKTNRLGAKDADLFMYISEAGNEVDLKAEHINQYIPSVESMDKLWTSGDWKVPTTDAGRNKAMLAVIDTVAADLGNTRTVCRSSYIHPWFLDAWTEGRLSQAWAEFADMRAMGNMTSGESTTLRLLKSAVKA